MNEKSLSVRSGPARASCGCCCAFGYALDITKEISQLLIFQKTVHASPHEEEAWEVYDKLYSGKGFFDDFIGKELKLEMSVKARNLDMASER